MFFFFFSSRRRYTRLVSDWSSDVCSSDLPSFQQIAYVDTETGELGEQRCAHREEAVKFYRDLAARGGIRSEERRVGKECRAGGVAYHERERKECVERAVREENETEIDCEA